MLDGAAGSRIGVRGGASARALSKEGTMARKSSPAPRGQRAPDGGDVRKQQAAKANAVAAAMPFNANKAAEHGLDNAIDPPTGTSVDAPADVGASTLSEANASTKTGAAATPGVNRAVAPLANQRADSAGAALTTNQGVPVGDNQ